MSRVGILTFHEGINHGGFFQAYCLYRAILDLGHDCEIIHYKNRTHWIREYKVFLLRRRIRPLVNNIRKIRKFRHDLRHMNLAGRLQKDIARIDTAKFDVIVVGSDIVWNYEWPFLGHDPAYFGHGLHAGRLVSYAPSFGNVSPESTPPDYVREGLKSFSRITVRDRNSAEIVEKQLGIRPPVVLDPTFLFDTTGQEAPIETQGDYILVYAFSLSKDEIESVRSFARARGLRTVAIGYPQRWCDVDNTSLGPFEWLAYFRSARYVLTSTFHGTIFSIKYQRDFAISNNDRIAQKIASILEQIGLEPRISAPDRPIGGILESPIDYEDVSRRLGPLVEESRRQLKEMIDA